MTPLQSNLVAISEIALAKESENDAFKSFLQSSEPGEIDQIVFDLNDRISPKIDCTNCGNCCRAFMINVNEEEANALATHLQMPVDELEEKYIEKGSGGRMIINTIPCHFLSENRCTIYTHRFSGCREFPHLYQPGFTKRLFSILMYYNTCPIIFNVVENLKLQTGFTTLR
ncbi:YkgJ family cysteine cluster protein [Ferruginibacter sp. SUN002]|uniref:YkgJ family cysteine cluster protein n=1 Tax=Ferruginibacter sp. SUN002 TaxID=2937789 RepID=UPI003D367985